jgi:hypothetical protein
MERVYIGIDNGISGSVGWITDGKSGFLKVPTKSEQNYTKKKGNITRIDYFGMDKLFKEEIFPDGIDLMEVPVMIMVERPMVNPTRFKATTSALRALEAVIIYLESINMPFEYADSKSWQKELLPQGTKGSPELKKASLDIGCRMFPMHKELIVKHGDADGILMAEYCRRKYK